VVGVEAVGGGVADLVDGLAHDVGDRQVDRRGDLACHDDEAGRHQRLAGHTRVGVGLERGVEHGVGDLVGHLVGVAFVDRLGG